MSRTMEVGAQKESQEELQRTKNKQRKQHKTNRNKTTKKDTGGGTNKKSPCFLVKMSPAEGRRRFHKNTAYARLGVDGVQGGLGVPGV